jgi:probable F420-dependent oxidoreductase
MKFGILADVTEDTVPITDLARMVEEAGLESLFLTQHTHIPASRSDILDLEEHRFDAHLLDPFVALAAAAAVTSRLGIGTGICQVAQHDPIILAKQVATLDRISGGRFLFGVGPGWLEDEMRNHGVDPARRWAAVRERVLAMKQIWSNDVAEFHGDLIDFDPILLWPKPVQRPHPPVLVAGRAPHALERVVDYGDGWMPLVSDGIELETDLLGLRRLCQEAGRDAAPVTAVVWEIEQQLVQRFADLGIERCAVYLLPEDMDLVKSFLERWSSLATRFSN